MFCSSSPACSLDSVANDTSRSPNIRSDHWNIIQKLRDGSVYSHFYAFLNRCPRSPRRLVNTRLAVCKDILQRHQLRSIVSTYFRVSEFVDCFAYPTIHYPFGFHYQYSPSGWVAHFTSALSHHRRSVGSLPILFGNPVTDSSIQWSRGMKRPCINLNSPPVPSPGLER